jgi:hypothetical protein
VHTNVPDVGFFRLAASDELDTYDTCDVPGCRQPVYEDCGPFNVCCPHAVELGVVWTAKGEQESDKHLIRLAETGSDAQRWLARELLLKTKT